MIDVNLCRLCGVFINTSDRFLIYETSNDNEAPIADIINRYMPIQVSDNDEYPKMICCNCKKQLEKIKTFFHTVKLGQSYLKCFYDEFKKNSSENADKNSSNIEKANLVCDENYLFVSVELLADENGIESHPINNYDKRPSTNIINEKNGNKITNVDKRVQCEYCQKTFAHKKGLVTHLKIHKGKKNFECNVCNTKYYQSGNLIEHMRIHTGEKPFQCDYCFVTFRTSSQLKTHIRSHNGDKPYKCSLCKKSFSYHNSLKSHLRRHNNDRQFTCEFCPKSFIDRTALVRHVRIHTGVKPYHCDICKKQFCTISYLKKHKQSHINDKNSTMWELTTKFQKTASNIDCINSSLINNNELDLNIDVRVDDLFLSSEEVQNLNDVLPPGNDNNLDDLLNINTSFQSLNSINFSESVLGLDDNNVS